MPLTVLYGCRPYVPGLERQTPCPVCKGNIRPGWWVYCEACSACGIPDHLLQGECRAEDVSTKPRPKIRFRPRNESSRKTTRREPGNAPK